jgi:hypothetical protein
MLILLILLIDISYSQNKSKNFLVFKGPYLGQKPPGMIPVEFPFNLMPEGYRLHRDPAFMSGGKEVYFSAINLSVRFSEKIFFMKIADGVWEPPEVASFSGDFFDGSPPISRDGSYLFFSSARTGDQRGILLHQELNFS